MEQFSVTAAREATVMAKAPRGCGVRLGIQRSGSSDRALFDRDEVSVSNTFSMRRPRSTRNELGEATLDDYGRGRSTSRDTKLSLTTV